MPIIKSAKKRVRTADRKHSINQLQRVGAKTAVRVAAVAITAKGQDAAKSASLAASKLDRAAQKGVIHKNKAARLKSRLATKLKTAGITAHAGTTKKAPVAKKKAAVKK
jgi:small subunit ribosomal protein S20